MKSCKENAIYFSNAIALIEKICSDNDMILDVYKTMYVTMNDVDNTFTGKKYLDEVIVTGNCNLALERFQIISNPGLDTDDFYDCNDVIDDSELCLEEKKKRKKKRKEDFLDKIPIHEILYDMNNLSLYKCKQCLKVFPKLHNLKRHFVRVHAPKDFVCSKCNKSFGSPAILEEHTIESHSGIKEICIQCGKKYASIKALKLHELSHKLILRCNNCNKIFNRRRNYQVHITSKKCEQGTSRRNVEKKYTCDYCNKRYACKGTLRVHIKFDHGNACHQVCSWCGKKFSCVSKLKAHTLTHTQEKNFSCEICGGCYVSKESLLYHTRIHTGEKPYQCDHCDQRFLSTSRRAEHIRRHHMEPTLECEVCHTKFRERSCLLRHKKRHFNPNSRLHFTKVAETEV